MSNRQEGRRDIDSTFQPMHEDAGKEKQFAGAELTSENLSADMDSIGHGKEFGGGQGHVTNFSENARNPAAAEEENQWHKTRKSGL
ncbi:hypothetical protein AAVH_07276 [Aphelenchoides avenae]|nr:hypothetical protein AAVH_07276 [Aphelenchus avenae]